MRQQSRRTSAGLGIALAASVFLFLVLANADYLLDEPLRFDGVYVLVWPHPRSVVSPRLGDLPLVTAVPHRNYLVFNRDGSLTWVDLDLPRAADGSQGAPGTYARNRSLVTVRIVGLGQTFFRSLGTVLFDPSDLDESYRYVPSSPFGDALARISQIERFESEMWDRPIPAPLLWRFRLQYWIPIALFLGWSTLLLRLPQRLIESNRRRCEAAAERRRLLASYTLRLGGKHSPAVVRFERYRSHISALRPHGNYTGLIRTLGDLRNVCEGILCIITATDQPDDFYLFDAYCWSFFLKRIRDSSDLLDVAWIRGVMTEARDAVEDTYEESRHSGFSDSIGPIYYSGSLIGSLISRNPERRNIARLAESIIEKHQTTEVRST
jgi:hypothetical protein